jgi:AAA domain/UvrD-like helicase C-terminal domain
LARLFLSKDFLPEYARLDKQVQSAVESAIGEFTEHTYAGLHLEKLTHSKDDRIRTIRIDGSWRGVVLAPDSGDVYCLLTVMLHDKAIAYAKSRRFSVNEAVGVLEVRNEEALDELQPTLQAIASRADERMFAKVSDADLKRLGVDAAVIPVVRLLATDAHLEALQSVLPEVQYTALYSIACGMTVDEAWVEVCQYLPAEKPLPTGIDTNDLTSALARTPGQVTPVSGPAALQQILAHPFAAWRTFLHPSQHAIAYQRSYAGPAQVTGSAGTGKTVTALHRAAYLSQQLASARRGPKDGPPILLTTFTTSLADALQAQLALLIGDERVRGLVEILNVDKLANRVVREARGALRIADPAVVRARFAIAAEEAGTELTPSFVEHEWEQVILGQDLRSEEAYLTCQRAGRGSPLTKAQRSQVWHVTQRVTADLGGAGESTYLQIVCEAARLLAESGRTLYRHVIIDEGQDLHPAQWRLLRAVVAPGPDDLFIAADPHQRIYNNRVSLASLGINVRGRSRRLSVNYRTTAEILTWAVPLLGTTPVTGLDDEAASLRGYRSPIHGRRPDSHAAATREDELAALARHISGWIESGIEPHAIGVAARSSAVAKQARDALKLARIPALALTTQSPKNAVRVGTMHGMKGLEFRAVAVIGVDDGAVPAMSAVTPADQDRLAHNQDLQRERCVLFVACTRARDYLYVSYTGRPSTFLPS